MAPPEEVRERSGKTNAPPSRRDGRAGPEAGPR